MPEIHYVTAFNDNYHWLLVNQDNKTAAVVDPGDATPVINWLEQNNTQLTDILITHRHNDHIGGVNTLRQHYPHVRVFGPATIKCIDHPVVESNAIILKTLNSTFTALNTPGHTDEHICYYNDSILFSGDTLFVGGCGRLFDGTPETMVASLSKLYRLPDHLQFYCAHEYTLANLKFAMEIDPDNKALTDFYQSMVKRRAADKPTVPNMLGLEKQINPYFTCLNDTHRHTMNIPDSAKISAVDALTYIRQTKDNWSDA